MIHLLLMLALSDVPVSNLVAPQGTTLTSNADGSLNLVIKVVVPVNSLDIRCASMDQHPDYTDGMCHWDSDGSPVLVHGPTLPKPASKKKKRKA